MPYPTPTQFSFIVSLAVLLIFVSAFADAHPQRSIYKTQGNYVILEISGKDRIYLEYSRFPALRLTIPLPTIDMVCSASDNSPETVCTTNYPGSQGFSDNGTGTLDTQDLRLSINPANLALSIFDKTKGNLLLTTLRAENLGQRQKMLIGTRDAELDIYGLGQQFDDPSVTDIDWEGQER